MRTESELGRNDRKNNMTTKLVLIAMLVIGLCLIFIGGTSAAGIIDTYSDFKTYVAQEKTDNTLRPVLSTDAENQKADFHSLMLKLWAQGNGYDKVTNIGILQSAIAGIGLYISFKKKKPNKSVHSIAGSARSE